MKQKLYNILNIKASESGQVFDLLSVQFFIGLSTAFLNTIAFTLFIYNFSVSELPYVYLTVAGVLIVLNFFYEKLEHRLSPFQLLKIIIVGALSLLLLLWTGLKSAHSHQFIFMLLVGNTVIYMLTGYAFWGLVSLLFNVRESRRVFSVVGSGDIPAKLIGYLVAPLLIPLIGLENVVWAAIISFIASLIIFNRKIKKKSWEQIRHKISHGQQHDTHNHQKQNLVSFFFENKLIFVISLLSILSYNVFVLIDYTFVSQVKIKFNNITDLAVYIAAFFAAGRVIAIILKLIFTSRVIDHLGIIACLFITPVALALFCVLFYVYADHSNYIVFIFGMMALLSEILRSTMQEPVFFILFQPLKEQLRLKGHLIAKGFTLPPSLIVVGLSLLGFYYFKVELSILLTVKIIILNLVVWAAVIFLIQKAYLSTLHKSIKKGTFAGDGQYMYDGESLNILLEKLKNGKTAEIIYSLDLLKKAGYKNLPQLLEEQLQSRDKLLRQYALGQLEAADECDTALLKQMLQKEQDPDVQQMLIAALCKHDPGFLEEITQKLSELEHAAKKTLIINLLNHHEFHYLLKAGNEIDRLIKSANPEDRKLSLEIITELKHVQFTQTISLLMHDNDLSVQRMAVAAACKLRLSALLPQVLELGKQMSTKPLVTKALLFYGDKLFDDIKKLPAESVQSITPDLIKIAPAIKGDNCRNFLLQHLSQPGEYTGKILHALWTQGYKPKAVTDNAHLEEILFACLKQGTSKINDCHNAHEYHNFSGIVNESLINEIKTDLVMSLKICAMLYDKRSVNRILEMVSVEKHNKIYNAIEMVEMELPKKISRDIILLIDFILDPAETKNTHTKVTGSIFEKIYLSDLFHYNPYTKSALMYCSWKNNNRPHLDTIAQKTIQNDHYIIQETRNFVLSNLPQE